MNNMMKIQNLIESGDQLAYRGQMARFRSIDNRGAEYEIIVDLDGKPTKFTKRDEAAIDLWMLNFVPIGTAAEVDEPQAQTAKLPAVAQKNQVPDLYTENKPMLSVLAEALMEDVKKLKTDPTYIHQAKAISNTVNTFIQLAKIQIQLSKGA
jgi:hypothetical protein